MSFGLLTLEIWGQQPTLPCQYKVTKMSILFRGFLNTWCFPMVSRLRLDSWVEWNNGAISLSPIDCRAVIIPGHCDHLPGLGERKFLYHGELLLDGVHFWKIFLSNIYKWHKILECIMTSWEHDIRVITDYIEEARDGSAATLSSCSVFFVTSVKGWMCHLWGEKDMLGPEILGQSIRDGFGAQSAILLLYFY